ncbi:MAG: 4'-phosphopantetheinyl transferase superfamily protein [Bacteroidales bacterium]|nr:4'-phosphopantetheinyl transferase superfamily protein [Bacteroidales bacterium]
MDGFSDADLADVAQSLTDLRRERISRFRFSLDRRLSAVAELLLRYGCGLTDGQPLPWISFASRGKPFFADNPSLHFNLSHCREAVACVVADCPVGIDVECFDSCDGQLARAVFSEAELNRLEIADAATAEGGECQFQKSGFAELWTRKEAFLKFTGEGLADDIAALGEPEGRASVFSWSYGKGYSCSVCLPQGVAADKTALEPIFLSKKELFSTLR